MKFTEKFPEQKREIKLKQVNLLALLHATAMIRELNSNSKDALPFYARTNHTKRVPGESILSTVILAYRGGTKRHSLFRYAVQAQFRPAQDSWVLLERS